MGASGIKRRKRRRALPPIAPRFDGVEGEPWARYAGAGAGLRFLTAILRRGKARSRFPLPPLAGYLAGAASFVSLFLVVWGVIWFLGHLFG